MSRHTATIEWKGSAGEEFVAGRYSRLHTIRFDGGAMLEGSPAPGNAPAAYTSDAAVDPEEMLVAAVSSCHMLWFLDFARRAGVVIDAYSDEAVGELTRRADGRIAFTRITLRPLVNSAADAEMLGRLHREAHDACFIANSVTAEVAVEPRSQG